MATADMKLSDPRSLPAPRRGEPLVARPAPQAKYLGKVVIEVWDVPATTPVGRDPMAGGAGLAYTTELAPSSSLSSRELVQRVADGFGPRWRLDRQTEDGTSEAASR